MFKLKGFSDYFEDYGGFKALIRSPYLITSLLIAIFMSKESALNITLAAKGVLPVTFVGMLICLVATLLSLKFNKSFYRVFVEEIEGEIAPIKVVVGSFMHFAIVQITALIYLILFQASGVNNNIILFLNTFIACYAISINIAACFFIYFLTKYHIKAIELELKK